MRLLPGACQAGTLGNVKLIVTPDFGRIDAWDFSFATKFLLGEALHRGKFPTWTRLLGGGFPLIGEGQIGAFFLPNLILFRLLPAAVAYNATLLLAVLLAGTGMYVLLRRLFLTPLAALFGGISFALSGAIVPQLTHHTLIQGVSLLPWVLVATDMLCEKFTPKRVALFAFVVSQQILAGFPQAVFITMLLALSYAAWQKKFWRFLLPGVLALGLGAIQLLPSYEFLTQSTVRGGFSPGDATYFSYPFVHLRTFLLPFLLGNPAFGTYPHFVLFDGSIFWENTGFFGTIGLLLALAGILLTRHTPQLRFFAVSAFVGTLLMLGKYSPLYIIFSFWPFSLFRVPSRFLWLVVSSLIILASAALNRVYAKRSRRWQLVALALFLANTAHLIVSWRSYHALVNADAWLTPPAIIASLPKAERIYTTGSALAHNTAFLTKGWQDIQPFYGLRESLAPDSNAIWEMASANVYAGRQITRQSILLSLVDSELVDASSTALLRALGVGTLLRTDETGSVKPERIDKPIRAYVATHIEEATTVAQAVAMLKAEGFEPGVSAVLEKSGIPNAPGSARVVFESDTRLALDVSMEDNGVLVVADTYYPGWQARVDGTQTPILPANISQRAVVVPKGTHTIEFFFRPRSLTIGGIISAVSLLATVILVVYPQPVARARTVQTVPARAPRRRRNLSASRIRTDSTRVS